MSKAIHEFIDNLEAHFGNRYSKDTVINTRSQGRRFLEKVGVKAAYSRADILGYMDYLIAAGLRPSSIAVIVGYVKTLLLANEIPWPLNTKDMHMGLPKGERQAPVLSREDVFLLIEGVKAVDNYDAAAVALATVWGLRATEITQALNAGLDGKLLVVQSAKAGEVRRHSIPRPLRQVLHFPPYPISRDSVQRMYDRIIVRHVHKPVAQEGWHSCRRAVVTHLIEAGAPENLVYRFMGWKRNDIIYRYWKPDAPSIDSSVYRLHPFLPAWANQQNTMTRR